jgi:hypothetical protein
VLFSFLLSLRIAVILENKSKPKFCSPLNPRTIADTKTLQNIYIPPKSPFGKGGLGRFAPGAQIKRVSWLRSTANAVKIAKS